MIQNINHNHDVIRSYAQKDDLISPRNIHRNQNGKINALLLDTPVCYLLF